MSAKPDDFAFPHDLPAPFEPFTSFRDGPLPKPRVHPIPFPDPEAENQRRIARMRTMRLQDLQLQRESLLLNGLATARDEGTKAGFEQGYREGTHWGLICGIAGGVIIGAATVVGLIHLGMGWSA